VHRCVSVSAGGDPDASKVPSLSGVLQPRTSFEAYKELARTESHAWTAGDRSVLMRRNKRRNVEGDVLKRPYASRDYWCGVCVCYGV
jgi:light-regulated signal transduction histidine kinase (bacteriophytochrome)